MLRNIRLSRKGKGNKNIENTRGYIQTRQGCGEIFQPHSHWVLCISCASVRVVVHTSTGALGSYSMEWQSLELVPHWGKQLLQSGLKYYTSSQNSPYNNRQYYVSSVFSRKNQIKKIAYIDHQHSTSQIEWKEFRHPFLHIQYQKIQHRRRRFWTGDKSRVRETVSSTSLTTNKTQGRPPLDTNNWDRVRLIRPVAEYQEEILIIC